MEGRRDAYRVLVGKHEGERPLGRSCHSWEVNIKMAFLGTIILSCYIISGYLNPDKHDAGYGVHMLCLSGFKWLLIKLALQAVGW
jgi:hypothetical protein